MDFYRFALIFVSLHCVFTVISSCTAPPAFWCDDHTIAEECGVVEQCGHYNDTVYKQKVKLKIIYEALCPACAEFISMTLYNITWLQWEGWQFIDLELVPYGNAHSVLTDDGSYQITCQHGSDECWLNRMHSCVMDVVKDVHQWLPVISCMERASDTMTPINAANHCLETMVSSLQRHLIWACQNGSYGDELQKRAADETDWLVPDKHLRVPWVVVNDVSLSSVQYLADYGHNEPILYYALRHWFRGGRDPKINKFGAKPKAVQMSTPVPFGEKRKCIGLDALLGNC